MSTNTELTEHDVEKTALFAYDAISQSFKAVQVDDATGALIFGGAVTSDSVARTTASVTATGQYLTTSVVGRSTVVVDLTGAAFSGLAWHFQVSSDGTNWFNVEGRVADNLQWERNPSNYSNASVPKAWIIDVGGFSQFRIDVTAFTSGTATFGMRLTSFANPRVVVPTQSDAPSLQMMANQGPPGSVATSWRVVVTDLADIMAVNTDGSINVFPKSANLVQQATSAANTTVTATLPAAGAGLFHYITKIVVEIQATGARAASNVVDFTTTNLPNTPSFGVDGDALVQGQIRRLVQNFDIPLKSSTANTNTTVVAPATGANSNSRITVFYYTGP